MPNTDTAVQSGDNGKPIRRADIRLARDPLRGYGWRVSGSSIRASDSDRARVLEVLHTAYAEGRITYEEHDERTAAAVAAKTFGDLGALTADLVPVQLPAQTPGLPDASSAPSPRSAPHPANAEVDRITAALSEVRRVGRWRVHRRSIVNVFLGSVHLDLTEAAFDAPLVDLTVTQLMGSLLVRLPTGTNVRDETTSFLGETTVKDLGRPNPALPTVVIRGTNLLGEIKVRGPRRVSIWRRALA